ncbi:MAG: efflux RND transporter periplasmic adaptor subunit [Bacteroidota bacterium]
MKNITINFLSLIFLLIASCGLQEKNHDKQADHNHHDHEHDHEHAEESFLIVNYSEEIELFAEADHLVMNERSSIMTHLTWLANFKPVKNAVVTLRLITKDGEITQTIDQQVKPGTYMLDITPRSTGSAQMIFEVKKNEETFILPGGEVTIYSNAHEALHAHEGESEDHPGSIPFTKEQSWQIDFKTEEVDLYPMSEIIKSVGELQTSPTDEMTLVAGTHGNVMLLHNDLLPGKPVNSGQPLINLTGSALAEGNTRERFVQAANNFGKAEKDYERARSLWQEQIISEQDFLEAKRDYENAKVIYNNLSENFSESGEIIKSELNGFVKEVYVKHGEHVEAGKPLLKLYRNKEMMLEVQVQRKYAQLFSSISGANILMPDGSSYTLEDLDGQMITYSRSTSDKNRMLPVYFRITNPGSWITGTISDVFLKTTVEEKVIAVPNSALIEEQGNFSVLVQINPELFEKRAVETGQNDGKYTMITKGLSEKERIVIRGAIMVKLAAASSAIDPHSCHVH